MHIDAYCNTEATTSLIRQHIPAASLVQENAEQLVYTLPLKDMDKFAGINWFSPSSCCRVGGLQKRNPSSVAVACDFR